MAKNKATSESAAAEGKPSRKTVCPVSRQAFRNHAKPVTVTFNGQPMAASVKEFSTGSLGWYLSGKAIVEVDGVPVQVQIGMNAAAVGSKGLPPIS